MKKYIVRFETNLNASMRLEVKAKNWSDAKKKVQKKFPSAFNVSGLREVKYPFRAWDAHNIKTKQNDNKNSDFKIKQKKSDAKRFATISSIGNGRLQNETIKRKLPFRNEARN